ILFDLLNPIVEQHASIPSLFLSGIWELNLGLLAIGRAEEAERLVRRAAGTANPERTPRGWQLHLLAAQHAMGRQDMDEALSDIVNAVQHIDRALWHVTASEDIPTVLSPEVDAMADLARLAFYVIRREPDTLGALGRFVADVRAAPVLTSRLRRRV